MKEGSTTVRNADGYRAIIFEIPKKNEKSNKVQAECCFMQLWSAPFGHKGQPTRAVQAPPRCRRTGQHNGKGADYTALTVE